jgi:RND family efflux transporter MFP subunit
MKKLPVKVMAAVMAMGLLALLPGCQPAPKTAQPQYATVTKGDISTDITASGNLAYLLTEDVAFDVSGTTDNPVTVKEVLVKVGQTVSKRQALVKADESVLKTQMNDAEVTYKQAQLSYQQSQNSYKQQDYALETAQRALDTANKNLVDAQKQSTGETIFTYKPKLFEVDENLEKAVAAIDDNLARANGGESITLYSALNLVRQYLVTAEKLTSVTYSLSAIEGMPVADAIKAYEALVDAQRTAQQNYTNAQKTLESSKMSLELAQASFERAQATYEEKKLLLSKAVLYAPFDGFVTAVPVKGGSNVSKGLVAVVVADPNKYQAGILVSEKDIDKVTVGTTGYVTVDTLTGQFPATVTEVAPTATVSSGVVNYSVTVEVTQKEPAKTTTSAAGVTIVDQTGKLRHGQTITVTLQTNKRSGVLMVAKSAITTRGNQPFVNLVQPDGTTVEKPIRTGLSNWQYTEVTSGLNAGDKVLLPGTSASTSTTTPTSRSTTAVTIPGLNGGGPVGPPPGR